MDTALPGLDMPETADAAGYRVLARKYRPQSFDTLIGQDALVRTLRNAIASGRIHHGYMLTGVRGVGKTTTARLIARALNYRGPDGTGQPTVGPTDDCPVCRAIADGRHVDVIEMAAFGDDIREVIDGARYAPTEARYKVYIIDEVHMLSKNAFNALLKTLEEPPPSVIFIFATTEIRKVPVTVLSRCMRFDLRRVPASLLVDHFGGIAEKENVAIEPEALALIARAADGSVRDGLSLMDQAIALGDGKNVSAAEVRDMLGLADRQLTFDLMEAVIEGQPTQALEIYANLHKAGAEALTVIQDLLELTHFITRCALAPEAGRSADVPEAEATRATALAGKLAMPALTRIWQILMNGLQEVQRAPQPYMAAEMILLRLCHASGLPDPADLVRQLTENGGAAALAASPAGAGSSGGPAASANQNLRAYGNGNSPASGTSMALPSRSASSAIAAARQVQASPAAAMQPAAATAPQTEVALVPPPVDFDAVIALLGQKAEKLLEGELRLDAKVVTYEIGRIQLEDGTRVTSGQGLRLSRLLTEWTGQPWIVELVRGQGQATLKDRQSEAIRLEREEASRHPVIARIKEAFPGTEILEIRDLSKGGEASTDDPGATGAIGGEQEPAFDPEDPGFSGDEYEVDF